jgi:hypothetical protein
MVLAFEPRSAQAAAGSFRIPVEQVLFDPSVVARESVESKGVPAADRQPAAFVDL